MSEAMRAPGDLRLLAGFLALPGDFFLAAAAGPDSNRDTPPPSELNQRVYSA